MLITTHSLVGGAIGQAAGSLPLAFTLGFLSHLVLDKIPHFDLGIWHKPGDRYKLGKREWIIIILDIITALALLLLLIPKSVQAPFIVGAIGGVILDLIDNVPWWKGGIEKSRWLGWTSRIHNYFHFSKSGFIQQHKWSILFLQILLIFLIFWYIKL
jgi:hypothetical protein